jgi:hypothetical protein
MSADGIEIESGCYYWSAGRGTKRVRAHSAEEAANVFAERKARKAYGRRGYVRTLRMDSWAQSGTSATFEAFIGHDGSEPRTTVGHNVWISVTRGNLVAREGADAQGTVCAAVHYAES